jgi:hypothetical protein
MSVVVGLGVKADEIVQVSDEDSYYLSLIQTHIPMPLLYNCTSDYFIRKFDQKEVYLVRNATRIYVTRAAVLDSMNKTFDDVIVLEEDEDIDIFPLSNIEL